jgi:hypothetical protein
MLKSLLMDTGGRSSRISIIPFSLQVRFPIHFIPILHNVIYTAPLPDHNISLFTSQYIVSKGGSGGSASAKLQATTNQEISVQQGQFQRNQQKAIDVLLSKCCEVSLEVPTARVRSTQKIYGA